MTQEERESACRALTRYHSKDSAIEVNEEMTRLYVALKRHHQSEDPGKKDIRVRLEHLKHWKVKATSLVAGYWYGGLSVVSNSICKSFEMDATASPN